jgi:hypothetical protein
MTLAFALALACGDKPETETAAAAEPAPKSTLVPDDKLSQAFGDKLFELDIKRFKPVDAAGGASLVYSSVTFQPDGSWLAKGEVSVADESMPCQEAGTWSMDAASTKDTADMSWNIEKTSCAGREAPQELRLEVTILDSGNVKVKFR